MANNTRGIAGDDFVRTYNEIRAKATKVKDAQIAEMMGLTYKSLQKAKDRARKRGLKLYATDRYPQPVMPPDLSLPRVRRRLLAQRAAKYASRNTEWKLRGLCNEVDESAFFPPEDAEPQTLPCDHCPVRTQCLIDALAHENTVGIWGGVLFPDGAESVDLDVLIKELEA